MRMTLSGGAMRLTGLIKQNLKHIILKKAPQLAGSLKQDPMGDPSSFLAKTESFNCSTRGTHKFTRQLLKVDMIQVTRGPL